MGAPSNGSTTPELYTEVVILALVPVMLFQLRPSLNFDTQPARAGEIHGKCVFQVVCAVSGFSPNSVSLLALTFSHGRTQGWHRP